jgi:hypothetical protein
MTNLIEGIQNECNRVREILPAYEEFGPVGFFGLTMLKAAITEDESSTASGDVVRMLRAYTRLKDCE